MENLKVLYVAMKYDYGDKTRGFSFEHENFYKSIVHIFKDVIYFDFMDLYKRFGKEYMNQLLLQTVKKEKPDLMFCCLYKDEFEMDAIKEISEKTNTITLNWFCDDDWKFDGYSKYWAPCFNYVATTSMEAYEKYKKMGYSNAILTQWACNIHDYKKLNLNKKYDVTFVGKAHGPRFEWINNIKNSGVNIQYWGFGWRDYSNFILLRDSFLTRKFPKLKFYKDRLIVLIKNSTRLSQPQMVRVFNQSKINLNLALASTSQVDEIKGRNFEIPGCGGFLLTTYANHLEDYYDIGKEIVCFEDIDDMKSKINYYLSNETEREKIAEAGYQRTIKEHSYENRFYDIIKTIGLLK